ncbi:MAG TPA: glycosyltransferase [Acidiphilium sp.]|nr:MAG: glycosyl transferase [Acidiphilium sp. 21-60-14]OYV91372.1 MAG: glycosyl transferase [Acidiphilium sp. 37-60-79]OZB41367.1 MAG: glycosyl transferase [Acidiphilium sp. 34-60-192]HQT87298.1 glycosyltransferase [Acidiphilium sp.]HQU23225.1 glycosyltransferase [Acidiphilium sp.]
MRFLFVHQNFPGQYLHLVRHLLADGGHDIVFMTEPNQNEIPGVRKVTYARPPATHQAVFPSAREFDVAMRRAESAYHGAKQIKALGFEPDIILGHHGWGELLNLPDIYPGVPILGYFEFYYRIDGTDVNFDPEFPMAPERFGAVRAKNGVNHLAIGLEQYGQTPTEWQWSTYPAWARSRMSIIREGVDLQLCAPKPALRQQTLTIGKLSVTPKQKLITFVARNLEPYRGFHVLMRALPAILAARKDVVVSIVGGDEISYGAPPAQGNWRNVMMQEVGAGIDLSRVRFMGKVAYGDHLQLLQRSDAHIYLSYPFVASWSLREALAVGAPVIGGDTATVTEFVKHGETGLVAPTLDPASLARTVLGLLEDRKLAQRLGANARKFAEATLDLNAYLAYYCQEIERITGKSLADKPSARPSASSRAAPTAKRPVKSRVQPATPSTAPAPRPKQRRARP